MDELIAWYNVHKRDLPWRRTRDPYAILVSEAMAQQTRIETVRAYFATWMAKWPNVEALAKASEEDVMAAWSGLGYYRRARNLLAAAKLIAASGWPQDLSDLPGVGPYTAAAVGSIAFGRPVACVDGNVERVVSRLFDVPEDVRTSAGRKRIQQLAQGILSGEPGDWNQAVMELGATVCKPNPKCDACPVVVHCKSHATGNQTERPNKPRKKAAREEAVNFAVLEQGGKVLLVRRPPGLLGGTWMLPGGDGPLVETVWQQAGIRIDARPVGNARHAFTHRIWDMAVHQGEVLDVAHNNPGLPTQWVDWSDLDSVGLSTAARKALAVYRR